MRARRDEMADITEVDVCDGKYTFVLDEGTDHLTEIKRYHEPWSSRIEPGLEVRYGRAIGALAAEVNAARQVNKRLYLALAVVREAYDEGPLTPEHIAVVDKAMALARGEG
jgi:hypothetical protein